jgi:hypothetical protein
MKKEDWINRVMESHRDLERKDPSDDTFSKILEKISTLKNEVESYAWLKIAAILFVSFSLTQTIVSAGKSQLEEEATEFVSVNNNNFYE